MSDAHFLDRLSARLAGQIGVPLALAKQRVQAVAITARDRDDASRGAVASAVSRALKYR